MSNLRISSSKFCMFMICFTLSFSSSLFARMNDAQKNEIYMRECLAIKDIYVRGSYKIDCNNNFHHFNYDSSSKYYKSYIAKKSRVKIAGYNILHPGMAKTSFKDFELVANVINNWDVVAGLELIASVSRDKHVNQTILNNLNKFPAETLQQMYRAPGYLKILNELRKLDPSWALILTPRGEAAADSSVQELVGFYYRGRKVRPKANEYCKNYGVETYKTKTYACIPKFDGSFLESNLRDVFSRRPFMGSFESGNFDFTLLASHIVFTSPSENNKMRNILMPTFGVSHYTQLGQGVTSSNYARFAEVKAITAFMNKLRNFYSEDDVILVGDLNLDHDNLFWQNILPIMPNADILVGVPTTMSSKRFSTNGEETGGYSSNYDHFIFDYTKTDECIQDGYYTTEAYDILNSPVANEVHRRYIVRGKRNSNGTYSQLSNATAKAKHVITYFEEQLSRLYTIKHGKIVQDEYHYEKKLNDLKRRVFDSQFSDKTYYKVFSEVLSDHVPVFMSCSTQ